MAAADALLHKLKSGTPPTPHDSSPQLSSATRVFLLARASYPQGLMPSRYNPATLSYTSHSREYIYPVYTIKLLAPAILLWSLLSIPLVLEEGGLLRRSGSAKVGTKTGSVRVSVRPNELPSTSGVVGLNT